eukprot:bmy_21386T0
MKSQTNSKFFPEKFSKSLLHALPSSEVEHSSNVTLKCQSDVPNVTFVLGKLQGSGYKRECNSTGQDTKFLLTDLKPKDVGQYFCTYKTVTVEKWELSTPKSSLSPPSPASLSFSSSLPSSSSTDAFSTIHHMKNPPREPAIPNFPSRELQVYPNWKEYLN